MLFFASPKAGNQKFEVLKRKLLLMSLLNRNVDITLWKLRKVSI